jgi:hypothetical protein
MSPVNESELVQLLANAQRMGSKPLVDLEALDDFDLETGYRISQAQQELLGEEVALYKTVLRNDGLPAVASPIWKSRVGYSEHNYVFPACFDIIGFEFELGVKLARDILPTESLDDDSIQEAIEYYFLGIEIVGTRLKLDNESQKTPTPAQSLADHNTALGYVIGSKCTRDMDVLGLAVTFEVEGKEIDRKLAAPGCSTVLASLIAYAKVQQPHLPLCAGTIITPGALSGLVRIPDATKGHIVARLGDEEPVGFYIK